MNDLDALLATHEVDGRIWPSYGQWGVANVPATIASMLGTDTTRALPIVSAFDTDTIDHVVLVVIDGLGLHRFDSLRTELDSLDRLASASESRPLSSTYPSETAAAMITLYTGLQPIEHGLIGWYTRFEQPTTIAHSLPFLTLDGNPLTEATGHEANELFDPNRRETIPERLVNAGVEVFIHNPNHIVTSHASRLAAGPASLSGYDTIEGAFETVVDRIEMASGQSYQLVYYPDADSEGHHEGTHSKVFTDAVDRVSTAMTDRFIDVLDPSIAERTAVLVVADHGQINTDPATNVDLRHLEASRGIPLQDNLERTEDGEPIYLAGGPRNVQLHLKSDSVETLASSFEEHIECRTLDADSIITNQLFGDRPAGPLFEPRVPDLLVIPDTKGVWYPDHELEHIGMHGGLHPDEMLVRLLYATAHDLK